MSHTLLLFLATGYTPPTAYTGCFFSPRRMSPWINYQFYAKYIVTTSLKATWPQKLSPPVTTGLLDVHRHYCVLWIHCNSTRSIISALAELYCCCSLLSLYELKRIRADFLTQRLRINARLHLRDRSDLKMNQLIQFTFSFSRSDYTVRS